tara:strand:+ start:5294 stop:5914 length:621 start_codon:yes stop_codon:yes gene_type:complete
MTEGKRFLDKCLQTKVITSPWPYQILDNTLSKDTFTKLEQQCVEKFNFETKELHHIFPKNFTEYKLDFYDDIVDICTNLLKNYKALCGMFPNYRTYPNLGINAHISITPPLPYKFHIHQEGLEKIWSSVTYITPKHNVGTKMYTAQTEDAFVKEAPWVPNSTFIFCGQQGYTWHSYESNQNTNRITLNLFIQKTRKNKCFIEMGDL